MNLDIVDIAPRWRMLDELTLWKRMLGGGLQLLRDYVRFLRHLWDPPDVVHLTTSGQLAVVRDIFILVTARLVGVPTVYHIRFGRIPQIAQDNTREWRMMVLAIRMANTVIAIDPSTMATIKQRLPDSRVLRVPNGVDLTELPPRGESSTLHTVIFLGWVIPTKGINELIQAWKALAIEGWRCLVVGPGSEKYRWELLDRFQTANFEFLSEQSHADAMRLMAASDVFVLPSHTEGFPNVIIEAMAMGKPIIATSVGAIPEMLAGECGVLVPPKNIDALCAALRRVLSDVDLRTAMGARAQQKACSVYAMKKVFEQLVSVWRGAATGRREQ